MTEELHHRWTEKTKEWVHLDNDARRFEELRKSVFSEIVNRMEGKSIAEREHKAHATGQYMGHIKQMVQARTLANVAKAEADGMKLQWETWRTINATRRKEMGML